MLLALGLRVVQRSGWSSASVLAVAVFFSSPFVVMSAHLLGYYDNLIIVLTVIALALLMKGQAWMAAGMQALAVFVHETAMLLGFPMFCLAWLLINSERRTIGARRLAFSPLVLPVVAFVSVAAAASLYVPDGLEASYAQRLSRFPFIEENRSTLVPWWLTITFAEYYGLEGPRLVERVTSTAMYGLVFPSMLASLCFLFDAHGVRLRSVQWAALFGVCLVPQVLHAVAVDTPRIWTYSILCSFLALWIYSETLPARSEVSPAVRLLCVAALVTNVVSLTPLMDGETDHLGAGMRLLLYSPVLGALLALAWHEGGAQTTVRL